MDCKSVGVCLRRFESCTCPAVQTAPHLVRRVRGTRHTVVHINNAPEQAVDLAVAVRQEQAIAAVQQEQAIAAVRQEQNLPRGDWR